MNQSAFNKRENEWFDYYDHFPYFSPDVVREGCHPRIMEHREACEKAIVLVHGLTDSPYFMTAIADFFFDRLGYNVYLPLLHCHGLKDPKGMDMDGARELSKLIEETDSIITGYNTKTPFPKPVFAAHSESDTTADIAGIESLEKVSDPNRFKFFRILKEDGVSHASLVLKDSIFAVDASGSDDCLEMKNPKFQNMMEAIVVFNKRSAASIC